ncbi:MAG TPA: hypothetical protein VFZ00_06715 [Solirubrobacter sp.]|jgi:hypothetical protein|nr:hypothetical protein [Solirubrobacter sp.]
MTSTTPISTTRDDRPTVLEMIEEVLDLGIGAVVVGLPFLLLSLPALVLFVALPAVLLLALVLPLALVGALLAGPPYLVVRWRRRRRDRITPTTGYRALRPIET